MRIPLRVFLLLALLTAFFSEAALAAAPGKGENARTSPSSPLERAIKEFDTLCADAKRSVRRDLWMALEENFSGIQKKSTGDNAVTAAFYFARCREEVGKRSYLADDHREAVARYALVAERYAKFGYAPTALYRQGSILHHRLRDHAASAEVLERLINNYPRAPELEGAKTLLAQAQKAGARSRASAKDEAGAASARAASAAPDQTERGRASTVTLKDITWQKKGQRAVITLVLDGQADFAHDYIPPRDKRPARVYLDMAGVIPASGIRSGMTLKDLVVTRIRTGSSEKGMRVTLECSGVYCYLVSRPDNAPQTIQIEVSLKDDLKDGIVVGGKDEDAPEQGASGAGAKEDQAKKTDGTKSAGPSAGGKGGRDAKGVEGGGKAAAGGGKAQADGGKATAGGGKGGRAKGGDAGATGKTRPAAGDKAGASKPEATKTAGVKESAVMEKLGLTVRTIMIDAGHGGKDPGAMAGGISEHIFTLAMARRVGALLEKRGFTVLYTRTSNVFISLQDRPDMANNQKADLFISIHVNANTVPSVRGMETYYLDTARQQDAVLVAARENAVSVQNISDLQVILTDLMLSSKLEESRHLARCVHRGILKRLRGAKLSVIDNGVKSAPFYVLMGARMPAILVEFGYVTNDTDAANLKKEAYLQKQAEGLVDGIIQYKTELARSVPQGK
ncbi:N-acetylmuramoyl-L-alanine amidase [Desulfovibrio sp. OttesenSCG-928-A18]|nr:N-acetylmuramoyl-L-alanine amidase [Desulfovibrio sp. OttesenSCG-928-A18]